MPGFRDRAQQFAATAQRIANLRGAVEEAAVLAQAKAQLIETGYDNWNSGTDLFTLTLEIPIPAYAAIEGVREKLERALLKRVQDLIRTEAGVAITEVVISPTLAEAEPSQPRLGVQSQEEPAPAFWTPGHFRLFITHPSKVKQFAHDLKAALAGYQIAAFVAHDDIEPTREWQAEIESALRTMDALTALITEDFVVSKWCDQEVGIAIGRGKLVVPVRAGADPHGFLGKYQGLNAQTLNSSDIARKIFEIIVKHDLSTPRMADALIERLSGSGSYVNAKRTMDLLEALPRLNSTQVSRLIATVEENSQVKDAFGVPGRVTELAKKVGQPDAS
jgi:hypothetical protein